MMTQLHFWVSNPFKSYRPVNGSVLKIKIYFQLPASFLALKWPGSNFFMRFLSIVNLTASLNMDFSGSGPIWVLWVIHSNSWTWPEWERKRLWQNERGRGRSGPEIPHMKLSLHEGRSAEKPDLPWDCVPAPESQCSCQPPYRYLLL